MLNKLITAVNNLSELLIVLGTILPILKTDKFFSQEKVNLLVAKLQGRVDNSGMLDESYKQKKMDSFKSGLDKKVSTYNSKVSRISTLPIKRILFACIFYLLSIFIPILTENKEFLFKKCPRKFY